MNAPDRLFRMVARMSRTVPRLAPLCGMAVCALTFHGIAAEPGAAAPRRVLRVGPTRDFKTPAAAALAARDGDTVEIDAGDYKGDVAVWRANGLTLRGIGGHAVLDAAGRSAQQKAVWVIKGNDTVVESILFTGCRVPDRNGAGIRQEGCNLTVRHCRFLNNENGILTGAAPDSHILIEHCEFARNGAGDGQSHNLYIGKVRRFTLRFCWSHHARIGHIVKSRAMENFILYNRLTDEADGSSSYLIDLPNGGLGVIVGNILHQGPAAENNVGVSFAAEGARNPVQDLYVVNNTFVNERRRGGIFVRAAGTNPKALIVNNLVAGTKAVLSGPGDVRNNVLTDLRGFVDAASYDYRLKPDAAGAGAGVAPGKAGDFDLAPEFQYVHPMDKRPRDRAAQLNAGAF